MAMQRTGFSEYLHLRRVAMGRRWKEILSDAYLSRATLHRIRHGDPYHPIAEVDSLRALTHALGFKSWSDLVAAYDRRDVKTGIDELPPPPPRQGKPQTPSKAAEPQQTNGQEDALVKLADALNLTPTEVARRLASQNPPLTRTLSPSADFPTGIHTSEMRPARMAPHFSSGIAASKPLEKLEEEDIESKQPVSTDDVRVFTIPVDGDCQEPVYKDGEIVLFSYDAFEREGILPGKSYYLAFTDGSTTFKRVFLDPRDPEVYLLRCWNSGRYPAERRIHFNDVVRIARAISKQVAPQE